MPTTSTTLATEADRATLERLWLMFQHDMSEFRGVLPNPDGTFRRERLDNAFTETGWAPYLFRWDDRPVGFAVVRGLDQEVRVLSSFFVVRGLRRSGIGRAAVRSVLGRHGGRWTIAFQDDNPAAVAFWRRVATEIAGKEWDEERRPVPERPELPPDSWISFEVPMSFASGSGRTE